MKVICIPYSHTFSHLARPLAIGRELLRRGHEVAFAGESPKLGYAAREGFETHHLHEPDPEELYGAIRAGKLRFVSDSELDRMVEADIELFRKVRPDVILTDGRFSAAISSQLEDILHVAIVNVSSTQYRALPYIPMFDFIPEKIAPEGSLRRDILNLVNLNIEMAVFNTTMSAFSRLTHKHSLQKKVTATNCLEGADLTLLSDIPEYFPARNLPQNHQYVGPLTWDLPQDHPNWWPPVRRAGPLVYVTMGTTGIPSFFPRLLSLFESHQLNAVVTTGGQGGYLESPSPFVQVEDFVEGGLVMEMCDIVVCHGGNGTIYQAFQHGKPVVGLPTIPDQKFNMRRVNALGAGLTVRWEDFERDPEVLLWTMETVLDQPSFLESAQRLQGLVGSCRAATVSADLIEKHCQRAGKF